ncbi:Zinc finger SWIM domain-containing protein 7-like Protein [Tribolium castaneum]|uniref:Zinc finger SWIM domain-containing protein 7-like Protein n=1 Tax=Tribolium castaneum TaxID=7070 RepID=D2A4V8_TRICA|nr:PREDICTED: zinc finger SWIM domain-containing protein 7 isoform X1 [Tribolium castaneum]EFA05169.1 Zinc finger SWIM domain-containing protein 7-like Protein [Tribolium castaneum]|eukprot:XP_001814766.1 PREDICTED: zinc finger SWIM domain-containing protein 7 isoform X1 [Tribolium castaneum]
MLKTAVVPKLAFELLQETENVYKGQKKLPNEILTQLHSFFGPTLSQATELLETCKITKYETKDKTRSIYKVGSNLERYTIYNNINFCQCQAFQLQVLQDRTSLTCKHVLALKLNQITGVLKTRSEIITDSQFVEFLNEQLSSLKE